MACVSQLVISAAANTCSSSSLSFKTNNLIQKFGRIDASKFRIRASSNDTEDCNDEECAPDKEVISGCYDLAVNGVEVGKVSVEWLAGEQTRVTGTFPPKKKGWTGYVEKDTAGQTNIYSVEPTVYVAETAISSGASGSSSDGAENTSAIVAGLALISIAAASSILLQVGKNPSQTQTVYSGPSLSYYVNKFKPTEFTEASAPLLSESSSVTVPSQVESSSATESRVPDESGTEIQPSASNLENLS
ncbi:Protein MAINTENANCE OF PSII UNDER HIGH LIGHT 1 [Bienertia sinuspersici]